MLFVEFLIRKYALSVYDDQSLLPLPQHLRLLEDFTVIEAILDQGLRDAWNVRRDALVQLLAHIDEFLLHHKCKNIVIEREVLVPLA